MTKKETAAKEAKRRFFESGKTLPICANYGCNNTVIVRDWRYYSFKHFCSNCNERMKKGLPPRDGVIFNKKNYCENIDGRLGFKCPVDPNFTWCNSDLHSDHIDGDHFNNDPSNLQTLCSICHSRKGAAEGDYNSAYKGRDLKSL